MLLNILRRKCGTSCFLFFVLSGLLFRLFHPITLEMKLQSFIVAGKLRDAPDALLSNRLFEYVIKLKDEKFIPVENFRPVFVNSPEECFQQLVRISDKN